MLQFAFRRENFFALALGRLDKEIRLVLAKFHQSAVNCFKRIVEMPSLAALFEKSEMDLAEVVLSHGPSERHALGGIFLQGFVRKRPPRAAPSRSPACRALGAHCRDSPGP